MTKIREETKSDNASDQEVTKQLMKIHDNSESASPTVEKYPLVFSKRFLLLVLTCMGCFFVVGIRICINMAVIDMTTNKTTVVGNETIHQPPEFNWDSKMIGLVQGCFNFGFLFASIGGYLATKFGGSVTNGVATAMESVLTILNPLCMDLGGIHGFVSCRIATGLLDGIAYASTAEVFSRWIPVTERSSFMAIVFCGVYISVAVSYPLFGYIGYYFGWRMMFYVTGGSSLIWSIIWLILVRNEPSEDKFISKKELLYITNNAETTPRNEIVHPYIKIFTSPAVLSLCIVKFIYGWGFSLLIGCLPLYVKDVTQVEVKEIGVISSIPNFTCIFMTPVAGAIMDYLQNNTKLNPNQIHKMLMTFGFVSSSILFVVAAYSTNFTLSMACFILIKLFLSFNFLIIQLICLYMAPKHASVVLGLSTIWFVVSLIVLPFAVGFIVENHTLQEWNMCFLLSAGMLMLAAIVHMIYGSSELQPWAK